MNAQRVEAIRARHLSSTNFERLDARKAEIAKQEVRRGLSKLRKLPERQPLRTEAITLFKQAIDSLNKVKNGNTTQELQESFERTGRAFEQYIDKYEQIKGV